MAGVALLARELGRPGTAAAALGWAVTGLLLIDPAWIDDAGFRLSVLATAGIIAWGSPLTERLAGAAPGRLRRWLAEILGVSLAAQAATTPVVLLDFGRLSLVAPAVNLLVVPLVPPAMAAGALALVRRRAGGARPAVDRRRPRRPAGLGPVRGDGRGRAVRRRAAAGEPRARAAMGLDQRGGRRSS